MKAQWISAAAVALGCSGSGASISKPAPAPGPPDSVLVLYADAAEVRVRVTAAGAAIPLPRLPPGDRYTLRSIRGDAAAGARVVGPSPLPSREGLRGLEVVATRGGRRVSGVVAEISNADIRIQSGDGDERLPLPVVIERAGQGKSTGAGIVELRPRPGTAGELVISSWLDRLRWKVGYAAVVEGQRATLQGWLSVTNDGDRAIEVEDVAIALAPAVDGAETAAFRVGRPLSVAAGATVEVPLMAPVRDLRAAIIEVHDPVGDRLDHEGRRPISRPGYGTSTHTEPRPLAIALAIDRRRIGALPAGTIAVYRRSGDALIAAGSGDAFAPAASASEPLLEIDGHQARAAAQTDKIAIGRSRQVSGRRWQAEIARDPLRRRLIEEIRVELTNRGDRPVVVDVREHLYRGLNWAIVYHNQAGSLVKTGSQEIRFAVEVPAGATRLVAYRVAYTW